MLVGGSPRRPGAPSVRPGAGWLTAAGWVAGAITTATVIGSPHLVFGLHSRTAHIVLDTVDACVSLLVAYLLWGRFRRTRRLQDLLLGQALLLLAVAGTAPRALGALLEVDRPGSVEVWSALLIRATAAVLVVLAAALGPGRRLRHRRRWLRQALPVAVLVVALALLWLARDALPVALEQDPPASATDPVIKGHPLLLVTQAGGAVAFALASLAFAAQAARRHDAVLLWLGPACALAAFARVNYLLFPSLYSDWVYTGDLLRTASYGVLLVGAGREIGEHWSGWATATVLEDRRRLARELHDGVVQELAYIRSTVLTADHPEREALVAASDRAMDEARAAVDALGRSPDEPLGLVLHRAARQVAERYGGQVVLDLDDPVRVDQERRHALVRITREAVSNALRHGDAHCVHLRLERDETGSSLVVQDDGRGFDASTTACGTGFGLTSMRERASALPGVLEIASARGRGTSVTVRWWDGPRRATGRTPGTEVEGDARRPA